MPTHSPNDPVDVKTPQPGYEATDVSVPGVIVFMVSLAVFLGVFFVFCFGMGKVINNALVKRDGPPNKWNEVMQTPGQAKPRNMESDPALQQQQLQQMIQRFPTPRLETDDGNQDLADLHDREGLLLDHYSWIDRSQGKVRIPIDKAMELIAQHGLPVVPSAQQPQEGNALMAGDSVPRIHVPLTDGFAPTAYEQELASSRKAPGEMGVGGRNQ